MQLCNVCNAEKDKSAFDGKRRQCRECRNALRRERNKARKENDPERHQQILADNRERAAAWYQNPENKERQLTRQNNRYHGDPEYREQVLREQKERYHNDPEFRAKVLARESSPEVRAKKAARLRYRYRNDPEYRAKVNARNMVYYSKNRPRLLARMRIWSKSPEVAAKLKKWRREYWRKNRERILANQRERYASDEEYKAAIQQRNREWRNSPKYRAKARLKRQTPEYRAKQRAYTTTPEHRKKARDYRRKRYHSDPVYKAVTLSRLTHRKRMTRSLLLSQSGKCASCGVDCDGATPGRVPHLDHIIPKSKGGADTIDNRQVLCRDCNLRKAAKDPIAFANERGRLFL